MRGVGGPIAYGDLYLLEQLGVGSQGDVWLATRGDGRPVVVKRAGTQVSEIPRLRKRFFHEAAIAQAIRHENVVRIESTGEHDGQPYLVMDYIEGLSVRQLIALHHTMQDAFDIGAAIDIVCDALAGLHALHTARDDEGTPLAIVHRDVAPKNLMFDRRGVTLLIDFGIGRSSRQTWKTATGMVLGSPGYMAPEQALGSAVDARSDVFAIGTVLFELLTMQRYIPGRNVAELLAGTIEVEFRAPSTIRGEIPPALDEVLARALEQDPSQRYASADGFRRALRTAYPERPHDGARRLLASLDWAEATRAHTRIIEQVEAARRTPTPEVLVRQSRSSLVSTRSIGVAVAFGVVVAVAATWTQNRDASPPVDIATAPVPEPRVEVAPVVAPRVEPEPAPPPPVEPAPPPSAPPRRITRRRPAPRDTTPPPPAPPPPSNAPSLETLVARTRRLMRAAASESQRQAATDLLFELNRLGAEAQRGRAVDLSDAARRVARLEAEAS